MAMYVVGHVPTYFKTLGSKNAGTWWLGKPLRLTVNYYKKQCFPVISRTIKYSLKQVISITYTQEKKVFLQLLLLKVFESFLFGDSKQL